ncbi:MAG TPA: type IV secretory system conjugative DNA transfer family protein [Bacilli bacterium]|nr:type IV secretory system conjugative DNA transfer family protein [Bacilli bacterium]
MDIIIILILIFIMIVYLYYFEPKIAKEKIKNKNEHGSARWSTTSEIKKNFSCEYTSNINKVGFPIYYSKDNKKVWFDNTTPHWLYLGSTGSGKSVTAVIPMCSFIATAKTKRSVFITDPKSEIFNATSKMFQDNGYKIITIDFRSPEMSNKINLLESIIIEYEKYIEYEKKSMMSINEDDKIKYNNESMQHLAENNRLITSLSTIIMTEKSSQDPFWNNSAKNLLEGIIGLFLEEYKSGKINREQITLSSIKKFQNSSMTDVNYKRLKAYIEDKQYGLKSKDSLTSILSSSENTYKSITSVFNEKMSLFDDINVENITSSSSFDFDILGKESTALFFIVPDEDKTYFTLITIIIGLLYRELVKLANMQENKKLPIEIDFLLDEFANCPPLNDIETIVSVARSRGMRFQFFIQSFAQLDNLYGKETSQIIMDNCGLAYLKTNTQETAEIVSKRLGNQTIESSSLNYSLSFVNNSGSKNTNLMGRQLLTADEIKQLHYKTIIFPVVGYPIFRDTIVFQKFSCYQKGKIERKINPLQKLTNTYFTVENLKINKTSMSDRFMKKVSQPRLTTEEEEVKNKKLLNELKVLFSKISEKFTNTDYEIEYHKEHNKLFAIMYLAKPFSHREMMQLAEIIDSNIFEYNLTTGSEDIIKKGRLAKLEICFIESEEKEGE